MLLNVKIRKLLPFLVKCRKNKIIEKEKKKVLNF